MRDTKSSLILRMKNAISKKKETAWKYNTDEELGPMGSFPIGVLTDVRITMKAKCIWWYMHSKPESYEFSSKRIAKDFNEGYRTIQSALRELDEFGYLYRQRKSSGRMFYKLYREHLTLPERKAKKALLKHFPDADKHPIEGYRITHQGAVKALEKAGFEYEQSEKLGYEYVDICAQGAIPMSDATLTKWIDLNLNHENRATGQEVAT